MMLPRVDTDLLAGNHILHPSLSPPWSSDWGPHLSYRLSFQPGPAQEIQKSVGPSEGSARSGFSILAQLALDPEPSLRGAVLGSVGCAAVILASTH